MLRASDILQQRAFNNRIEFIGNTVENHRRAVVMRTRNVLTGEQTLETDGVFIFIRPNSACLKTSGRALLITTRHADECAGRICRR